jgi:hypothetical protein
VLEFGVFAKLQAELEIRDESGISPLLLRRRAVRRKGELNSSTI